MKVLFMGTPDFAALAFERLCDEKFEVIGAVTQPDKPKGRGYALLPPPVKTAALARGIPVFQPETLKGGAFEKELEELAPDVIVVAAYGKLLPEYVLSYPRFGCVNIHASLLPRWRGAAPIQRCIMAGDRVSGVTTMLMDKGLDTGDILETAQTEITSEDNFETLHDRLAALGADLIVSTLRRLGGEGEPLSAKKQPDEGMTYAAKIEREDCMIDFSRSARELHDMIRGLSPVPLAQTILGGKRIKIVSSSVSDEETVCHELPGTVLNTDGGTVTVSCGKGTLDITGVLPEGKRNMAAADFIRGRGVSAGDVFGNCQK